MLYNNSIEKLIGLKDIIVKDVKNNYDEIHIQVENIVKEHSCPNCNSTRYGDKPFRSALRNFPSLNGRFTVREISRLK